MLCRPSGVDLFWGGRRFKWNEMTVRISGTENGCMCDNAWTALFTMTRCKQHHKCRGLITGQLVGGAKKESEKPCPGYGSGRSVGVT